MSSTLQTKPSGEGGRQYVGFEEYIEYQLKQARRGIRGADLLTGGVGAVLLTVGYLFLFVVTDHWVISGGWSQTSRYVLWVGFLGVLGVWFWYRLIRPWSRKVTSLYAASQLEHSHPELKSNLLTLVDLQQAGRPVSPVIIEAMERRAALNLQQVNVDDAVDRHMLTKLSYALLAMVVVLCVYTLASPKSLMSSAWRALFPMANVTLSTRTTILEVKPGDLTVLAHATPDIEATLSGAIPGEVRVLYTTSDRRMVDEAFQLQDSGEGVHRFRGRILGESGKGLMQNLTYRIEAGDAVSPTYSITVRQPPTATVNEVAYDYPKYMGLDDRTQTDSAIDAWEGTTVTVRATTNVPVDRATVLFSDSEDTALQAEELPMQIREGVNLAAQWQLRFRADGTFPRFYRIQLLKKSPTGDELVAVPTLHTQRIRADLPPKLEILHPTADLELPANGSLPVAFEASDPDFLLKSVVMKFEKDGEALTKQELLFDAPPFEPKTRGQHVLKLDQFAVEPGKMLTFWLEAKDNFEPFADRLHNITRSPKITITVINPVTPEQVTQELADQQEQADQKIEAAELNSNPAGDANAESQPQDAAPPEQPGEDQSPAEQQPDEAAEPMQDNPAGAEQEPLSTDGNEAETTDPQDQPESGDPLQNPPGQPKNSQPQNKKGPKSQPQPKQTPTGPPQTGQSPDAQPEPSATPDGQPNKAKASPQRKPKTGPQPAGIEQNSQPPEDGSQPEQTPTEKLQPGAPPRTSQPQPRKDKASPDEALAKLIERQQKRDQNANETPPLKQLKPEQPRNNEPPTGKPEPSDPAAGEKSAGVTEEPKPGNGEKPSQPPMKNGSQPEQSGSNTPPMPGEATEPMPPDEGSNPSDPMTAEKTTPPTPGKKPAPGSKPKPQPGAEEPETGEKVGEGEKTENGMPKENSVRPDPATPMKNGEKPPVEAAPQKTAGDKNPMPNSEPMNSGDMPDESKMPPGAPDSVKPKTNPPQGKPTPGQAPKKKETPPGPPAQKSGDPTAEAPMPDETGEPMPDSPMPDSPMPDASKIEPGAEEPGPEPAATPPASQNDAPPKGAEGAGEMPETDPPMGQDPMAKDPAQPAQKSGLKPGDKPQPGQGDQPKPGEQQPDKQKPTGSEKPTEKQKPAPADGSKPKEKQTPQPTEPSSPMSPSGLGGPGESSPGGEGSGSEGTPSGDGSKPGEPSKGGSKGGGEPSDGTPGEPSSGEGTPSDAAEPGESNGSPSSGEKSKNGQPKGKPKSAQTPKEPGPNVPADEGPMPDAAEGGEPEEGSAGGPPGGGGGGDQPEGTEEGSAPEEQPGVAKPAPKSAPSQPPKKGSQKKSGDKPGQPSQDQGGEEGGGAGGASGGDPSGPSGPPGEKASDGNAGPGPGAVNGGLKGGSNPEDTQPTEASGPLNSPEEAVNPENRKKAANLALERLQEELNRGEKPQELMDELGFDEADLDSFLKMMDQNLNSGADETSPEALARRRQFDELLKNVELETPGELKSGGTQPREASQSSGSIRRATPKKYESSEESFRKRMQKGK